MNTSNSTGLVFPVGKSPMKLLLSLGLHYMDTNVPENV